MAGLGNSTRTGTAPLLDALEAPGSANTANLRQGNQGATRNAIDEHGMPAGGTVDGIGLRIAWQDGPLGRSNDRQAPNGAFVETVLAGCHSRLAFYQTIGGGRYQCAENAEAMEHIQKALDILEARTRRREAAEIEGTHAEQQVNAS